MDKTRQNPSDPGEKDRSDSGAGAGKPDPTPDVNARFATTPHPPYYAVIFSNQRSETDDTGYGQMASHMDALARSQPGCLGLESTRDAEGFGITVSYWKDESAILAWKEDARHLVAQELGKEAWYQFYHLRVARVERDYTGPSGR